MSDNVRVLLTGGGGFIGSHCVAHWMRTTHWHVTVLDSFRHRGRVERLRPSVEMFPDRIRLAKVDLAEPMRDAQSGLAWAALKREPAFDVVVNMASESHVDRSIEDPVGTWRNNCNLVQTMLEYVREKPTGVFVQISTDEVYGPAAPGQLHEEWSPILPSNPYAASKAAQEALAISYWRTYGVPLVLTNTMNNFGEWQDSEKFIPKTIRSILDGQPVVVHGEPGHTGSRFYLHAANHADAIRHLVEQTVVSKYPLRAMPDRYNVVGEEEVTNEDMALLIGRILGVEPKLEFVDFHKTRPGHDRRYGLDGAKLASTGWSAPFPFADSLRQTVLWYTRNREALSDYRPQ